MEQAFSRPIVAPPPHSHNRFCRPQMLLLSWAWAKDSVAAASGPLQGRSPAPSIVSTFIALVPPL